MLVPNMQGNAADAGLPALTPGAPDPVIAPQHNRAPTSGGIAPQQQRSQLIDLALQQPGHRLPTSAPAGQAQVPRPLPQSLQKPPDAVQQVQQYEYQQRVRQLISSSATSARTAPAAHQQGPPQQRAQLAADASAAALPVQLPVKARLGRPPLSDRGPGGRLGGPGHPSGALLGSMPGMLVPCTAALNDSYAQQWSTCPLACCAPQQSMFHCYMIHC